jgi:hypothetical protein
VRIWREHGLLKKMPENINASRTSRTSKLAGALFQQISADTKDLGDIPRY